MLCCNGRRLYNRHDLVADAVIAIAHDARFQPRRDAPVYCLGPSLRRRHGALPGIPHSDRRIFYSPRRTCVENWMGLALFCHVKEEDGIAPGSLKSFGQEGSRNLSGMQPRGLGHFPGTYSPSLGLTHLQIEWTWFWVGNLQYLPPNPQTKKQNKTKQKESINYPHLIFPSQ